MIRLACPVLLALWLALWSREPAYADGKPQAAEPVTLHVRQSAPADLVGNDDVVLKQACDRLRKTGGTLVVGPGRWIIRRSLILPKNFTLRGEEGAVLAIPSPTLSAAPAAAGTKSLEIAGAHEFAGDILVQILPPVGSETFADGHTRMLELVRVERVEGQTLFLTDPLPQDVPAASRVGYPLKILQTHKHGLATIENLAFEGGKLDAIPMPGHSQRCGLWASTPWLGELREPPGRGVSVRHCSFRDFYGRAVAFYNQADGLVEGSLFERIADEAIDLDHYSENFRIVGNEIEDAKWGIVMNDASRNLVEHNRIEGAQIGIWSWWWDQLPREPEGQPNINEHNVIRHNFVRATSQSPIHIDRTCVRYTIEHNWVEGEIVVLEPDNTVRENTRLEPSRQPAKPR